jgi:hypothetical protein
MKHRVFNPISRSRIKIVREFTLEMYGYVLTDDTYSKLLRSRSSVFDKLLCEYTNKKYFQVKPIERNLHRWGLENREKTKNEMDYPW